MSSTNGATMTGPGATLSLCNWECHEALKDAYHEQGSTDPRPWREMQVRIGPRFCTYCYQCGGAIVTPEWCAEHGRGQCPDIRWELTKTGAEFVHEYQRLLATRTVPEEIRPLGEAQALRQPALTGFEVAAMFQYPPTEYPDEPEDWP